MDAVEQNLDELIARILAGDRQLFHQLIRPVERSIYFLCYSLLKNEQDAEDAAQDTAINIFRHLSSFRGDAKFKTWALAIARNEALARIRKAGRRQEESLDAGLETPGGEVTPLALTDWREIPSEALERKELGQLLRQAIGQLPELYRNVLLLRDIEEMDGRETAAALGISEAAVKVRLHRARIMLQRELAPQLPLYAPRKKRAFWGPGREGAR